MELTNSVIFRVEHVHTRKGPFQTDCEFTQFLCELLADHPRSHPAPLDDGLISGIGKKDVVFGCLSTNSLSKWIFIAQSEADNLWIAQELQSLGFVIRAYSAQLLKVGFSKLQATFPSSAAIELKTWTTLELLANAVHIEPSVLQKI